MFCFACMVCTIWLKFVFKAIEILSFSQYSWSIELQTILLGMHSVLRTHGVPCLFYSWWNFLLETVGILGLSKYSWPIRFQIVLLGTHSVHCLFIGNGKFLLKAVGILKLSKFSWSIGLQIVLLGTHGTHCLLSIAIENSCSKQLGFWASPNILDRIADCFVRRA